MPIAQLYAICGTFNNLSRYVTMLQEVAWLAARPTFLPENKGHCTYFNNTLSYYILILLILNRTTIADILALPCQPLYRSALIANTLNHQIQPGPPGPGQLIS